MDTNAQISSAQTSMAETSRAQISTDETSAVQTNMTSEAVQSARISEGKPASLKGPERRLLGQKGEGFACDFLRRSDFRIVERNWRCPAGEADIIALEEDELVFIEVKTRTSLYKGFPEDAVTRKKRQRYELIAAYYLSDYSGPSRRIRFDVIAIILTGENQAFLKHHRDAFAFGD